MPRPILRISYYCTHADCSLSLFRVLRTPLRNPALIDNFVRWPISRTFSCESRGASSVRDVASRASTFNLQIGKSTFQPVLVEHGKEAGGSARWNIAGSRSIHAKEGGGLGASSKECVVPSRKRDSLFFTSTNILLLLVNSKIVKELFIFYAAEIRGIRCYSLSIRDLDALYLTISYTYF